jgi:hypothetical protein
MIGKPVINNRTTRADGARTRRVLGLLVLGSVLIAISLIEPALGTAIAVAAAVLALFPRNGGSGSKDGAVSR